MLRCLDVFSGIGGFSLGLERTGGFKTVAFCEIEAYPRAVLKKHWPSVVCFNDVRLLNRQVLEMFDVEVDVICGGFPCQDISLAGKGAGLAGERSGLWSEYHRLIQEIRPRYAIIENVSALRGRGLDQVLRSLAAIGYDAEWHCIPASAVGAPHIRDRIWIVAHPRGSQAKFHPAVPAKGEPQFGGGSAHVADTGSAGFQTGREVPLCAIALQSLSTGSGYYRAVAGPNDSQRKWEESRLVESPVGGATDGLPRRLVRFRNTSALSGFGNAVVPAIPEILGRAILEFESHAAAESINLEPVASE